MSLSGVNAGYLDVRNAILRVGTLDVQTIVSGVDTATNIAKTNTILLWDDQGSDMNSPPFILTSATRSTSPPYLELGGGVAHVGIKLPNAWLGAFEVYMSDTTDASIKLHTYTTDTTTYGDTGYELVLNSSGVTLNYDGAQVATAAYTWTNDTWHQVVVGFERGAWTVSVDGTPTLIKDDIEREAVYANVGQYLRLDAASATTTKRVRYVKFAANGQWLQSNTGTLSYTQGKVTIGTHNASNQLLTIDSGSSYDALRITSNAEPIGPHMYLVDSFSNGMTINYMCHGHGGARNNSVEFRGSTSNPINFHFTPSDDLNNPEVVIDTSGRLGVGVGTEPSYLLDVGGTANTGALTTTSASITDVTHSTSKDTGALLVTDGGLGVESNIHSTNVFAASHVGVGTTATSYNLDVNGTANVGAITMNSNVYAPNLQVAQVASNLVTWNSATGDFMDSGGLISNKLAIVSEQPPSALTGDTTTIQGHGKYVVEVSSTANSANAKHQAFDKNSTGSAWLSAANYDANGDHTNSAVTLNSIQGEYIKLTLPYKTTLRHFTLACRNSANSTLQFPTDFTLLASNDGSSWTSLYSLSGGDTPSIAQVSTYIVNAASSYKTYAIVVEKISPNSGPSLQGGFSEWRLFTESFSVEGGIVSTTAASGLETGFTEHPVAPMTDYKTYVEGHGTYEASASTKGIWFHPTYGSPFDYVIGDNMWESSTNWSASNVYNNSNSTTDVGGTRHYGEWLQLKVPYPIVLSHTDVYPRTGYVERSPGSGTILGSNDGEHWYKLTEYSSKTYTAGVATKIDVNATTAYQYFRITVNKLANITYASAVDIGEWRLFSATGVTKMDNVLISGELAVHGGALQTSHIKWPKVPLKANESEGYVASASSVFDNFSFYQPYHVFEDKVEYINNTQPAWASGDGSFSSGSAGTSRTTGEDTFNHEWIQIQLPQAIQLSHFNILRRSKDNNRVNEAPKNGFMYGSNDGVTWTKLVAYSDLTYVDYQPTRVNVQSTIPYTYYRLAVTATIGSIDYVCLTELQLFESTLGVGTSATTAKLTVDGGLGLAKGSQVFAGSDVIAEFPKHDRPLTKYPEVNMTADSSGGYVASASSHLSDGQAFRCFDEFSGLFHTQYPYYTENGGTYDPGQTAVGSGSPASGTTLPSHELVSGYAGEYITLQLPKKIKPAKVEINTRADEGANLDQTQSGEELALVGSNDGSTWEVITTHTVTKYPDNNVDSYFFPVNTTKYYKHLGLICTNTGPVDSIYNTAWSMSNLRFWGYEEGDESVDIVHKSIPNKPGQQQLAVYYEARDPNSYSFADSTKVYDLSGSGVTGTLNGVGYDAVDNAFTFDGVNDYVESSITTLSGDQIHSISFWLKLTNSQIGSVRQDPFLIGNTSNAADKLSGMLIQSDNIYWYFSGNDIIIPSSSLSLIGKKWYNITLVYTGGGGTIANRKIYIDGLAYNGTITYGGVGYGNILAFDSSTSKIRIGKSTAFPLNGSIANFRVYGKALSADQVRELYEYDAERFGHRQNLVALHKGNLGVGVLHPTSRFEVAGADGLQEYPPKAMTGFETYMEGHGVFKTNPTILLSLGVYATPTWKVFDRSTDYFTNDIWHSERDSGEVSGSYGFYTGTSDTYTGTNSLNGLYGDYIILENPYKINVTKMYLKPRINNGNAINMIRAFTLMASNDGSSTWDILAQKSELTSWTSNGYTFDVQNTNHYIYYALVVTQAVGSYATLSELRYFGTPAPSSLEDGHLTLGKALTLPRVSGHPAGAETPRAESLVVHYDTTVDSVVSGSTVVDISGNGLNGTLTGDAAYSSTDRAFTFDGSGDYIFTGSIGNPAGAWIHSYSMWINLDSYSDKNIVLIGKDELTSRASSIALKSSTAIQWFFFGNDVTFSHSMSLGSWYHIVAVYDGGAPDSSRRMWINGTELTISLAGVGTALNLYANAEMRIGRRQYNSYPYYFDGSISNFKLWDVALTAEEVAMEYALGRTGKSINLTDTALCLGGTVPRAQLDVRGSALFGGNLGIGTTNPNQKLHLLGTGTGSSPKIRFETLNNGNYQYTVNGTEIGGIQFGADDYTWLTQHMSSEIVGIHRNPTYDGAQGDLVFKTSGTQGSAPTERMRIRHDGNVGIGTTNPAAKLHVSGDLNLGSSTNYLFRPSVYWYQTYSGTSGYARAFLENNNTWTLNVNGNDKMYIRPDAGVLLDNFTGQHRCFVDGVHSRNIDDYVGLVVCANKNAFTSASFNTYKGNRAIQMDETLPDVSLSKVARDKSCFGVISHIEDEEKREDTYGSITIPVPKELGDTRVYINSVGEGAMWVTNINGPLESGDYITTSNVAGYGQRQDDDILHNYTVAKITMDCDFEPPDIPVQRILKELSNITYWYQLEDATSNAYDRTQEETYYTLDRRVEVYGHVDEQSNVFVEPVHDLELYTKTQENIVSEEVYNALPEDEQVLYDSNTFTYTQVTELVPDVWGSLDTDEQNTYVHGYFNIVTDEVPSGTPGAVDCTRTLYKKIVNETKVEPATPEDYFSEVRQEWVNVLDAHDQLQWEDVPWGETEPAYKIRYLDADGQITTRHNEVHRAAFVGVTYHCG